MGILSAQGRPAQKPRLARKAADSPSSSLTKKLDDASETRDAGGQVDYERRR
jgi:hypothetical protein